MWTGRETLQSLDGALDEVRTQIQRADEEIQHISASQLALRQEQGQKYKKLAQIRLDQIISGEIVAGLDAADRRARELLLERERALASLQQQLDATHQQNEQLEREREAQLERVAVAAQTLDQAEAAVQAQLQTDHAYGEQLARAQSADNVAQHAEAKTAQAQTDRSEKGRPYESDPLFMYLWRRGFATSAYAANPLTRFLDNWVARLCDYRDARPNYAMLLDIPTRLRVHSQSVRATADQEFERLREHEQQAAQEKGVPVLRNAVTQTEDRLDEIDQRIDEAESANGLLLQQRAQFAAGEDDYYRDALQTLGAAIERENLGVIYQHVMATTTAEDDVVVHDLLDIDRRMQQHGETLAAHRRIHEKHLQRLRELEGVRHQFKRQRYDDVHSTFGDTSLLKMLLHQFLQGMAESNDLWRALQAAQRYRRMESDPDFGSGGFGRPGRGTWRSPFPRGGGGRRGGGFRTGGGF